jgi:hypothetical protein
MAILAGGGISHAAGFAGVSIMFATEHVILRVRTQKPRSIETLRDILDRLSIRVAAVDDSAATFRLTASNVYRHAQFSQNAACIASKD